MVKELAQKAKVAARQLAFAGTAEKNRALHFMATALTEGQERILFANRQDVADATAAGLPAPLIKRLALNPTKIAAMAKGLMDVAALPDPVGGTIETVERPNGLTIRKVRVPFGVVGIIYEARPNVTADGAGLCLKSGNAVILRGGKEALRSNLAIVFLLKEGLQRAGLSPELIQYVQDPGREAAAEMMTLRGLIDLLIPRGGANLIRTVVENATVPVIETGVGNCHIYVDKSADFVMAERVVLNAKLSNPAVCNAVETLLVHKDAVAGLLPRMLHLLRQAGVEVRGCEKVREIDPTVILADERDWETEYLDLVLAVRVVEDIAEALRHIAQYGTGHSEAIISNDEEAIRCFTAGVDAAAVYINASTRFTDGGEFGMGAEIGISTQKLHARGPMGLTELTTYKYVVEGNGQVRE